MCGSWSPDYPMESLDECHTPCAVEPLARLQEHCADAVFQRHSGQVGALIHESYPRTSGVLFVCSGMPCGLGMRTKLEQLS